MQNRIVHVPPLLAWCEPLVNYSALRTWGPHNPAITARRRWRIDQQLTIDCPKGVSNVVIRNLIALGPVFTPSGLRPGERYPTLEEILRTGEARPLVPPLA